MRARFTGSDGDVLLNEHRLSSELIWLGSAPRGAAELELVADLRPEVSGPVELGIQSVGHCILELDGRVLLDVRLATDSTDLGAELLFLSLIHISEPTRLGMISYAVFCLKK